MSCNQVKAARADFDKCFFDVCTKPLTVKARKHLGWIFEHTVEYALCRADQTQNWNDDAKKYVIPKLIEFAARVDAASRDIVRKKVLHREADFVIRKYRHDGPVVWCDGFFRTDPGAFDSAVP